jgi:hypothetical protein
MHRVATALASTWIALRLVACSGTEESDGDEVSCAAASCPFDYGTWDRSGAEVSLRRDLLSDAPAGDGDPPLGILRRACNFTSDCHGREAGAAKLYLGPPGTKSSGEPLALTEEDVREVLRGGQPITLLDGGQSEPVPRGLIDVMAKTAPGMPIVKPFEPENSFLMRKIDGCFEDLAATCESQSDDNASGHPCGDRMPAASKTLCAEELDTIRRWIAQGAKDN